MPPSEYVTGGRFPGKTGRRLERLILERRYGMPRGALRYVDLRDIGFEAPDRVWDHIPSPWGVLRRSLRAREVTSEDVFIDIGCGMGPVLVEAAARYDFRRVIGIDIVPQFTEVARETIARGRHRLRCGEIEVITGDVLEYEMPDDVTVAYLADPFHGPTFEAVIAKLVASVDRNPRRLRIIYNNPVEGGRLERTGRAHLVRYGRRRNRPWTTAPDLAMYEIEPSGDGVGSSAPTAPPRRLGKRLLRSLHGGRSGGSDRQERREATIQMTSNTPSRGSRVASLGSAHDLESLRAAFEHHHCVRLPRLLDGPLLDRVQSYVDEGEFSMREYEGMRTELFMEQGKAAELLMLLVNDPHLFEHVRTITGCKRIGRFDGGVYRGMPSLGHGEPWHGEIFGHHMVEMSIDLSTQPYSGGAFELRDRYSREVLHTVTDTQPGDAVLVRLAPSLQQRVTAVEGDSPQTVYAGRFMRFKTGASSELARLGAPV
ncbi:MAG: methyltransferase domain-containing protein [Solirubrobacterales bacterium]